MVTLCRVAGPKYIFSFSCLIKKGDQLVALKGASIIFLTTLSENNPCDHIIPSVRWSYVFLLPDTLYLDIFKRDKHCDWLCFDASFRPHKGQTAHK